VPFVLVRRVDIRLGVGDRRGHAFRIQFFFFLATR